MTRYLNPPRLIQFEQWIGIFMLGAAAVYYAQPVSPAFVWLEATFHTDIFPRLMGAGLLICGWLIAWMRCCSEWKFLVLTMPLAAYGVISTTYGLSGHQTSFLPGYEIYGLWLVLQVTYAQTVKLRGTSPAHD